MRTKMKAKGRGASRFSIGMRVVPTEQAVERNIEKRDTKGTVIAFAYGGYSIRVLRDGKKTPYSYHPDFWMPTNKRLR